MVLRAETGEADPELADWWTRFQTATEAEQKSMIRSGSRSTGRTRTRKRRIRNKASKNAPPPDARPVRAYIGLGGNLDQPVDRIRLARRAISDLEGVREAGFSSLYRSVPMGPADQPDYVNAVMAVDTVLEPLSLLDQLQVIEAANGRVRLGERWGPRTLDLDILLFGDAIIDMERLRVPHPGLCEREFVAGAPAGNCPWT